MLMHVNVNVNKTDRKKVTLDIVKRPKVWGIDTLIKHLIYVKTCINKIDIENIKIRSIVNGIIPVS